MNNRGYEREPAFYGYSSRAPPPIVYTVDSGDPYARYEERRPYRKPRRRSYSEESSSYASRSRTVEEPPDGGVRAWLTVLACAVLHMCAELVYYMFYDTVVISKYRNLRLLADGQPIDPTYDEFMVFENVSFTGAFVAALIAVYLGYRVVGVLGGVCVLVGFLVPAFLEPDDNWEWFGFLVGFLGGLGVSFWRFTAYVAVMEYFTRHRMMAIILSGFGRAIGTFAGYGILSNHFRVSRDVDSTQDDVTSLHEWEIFYFCQLVMAGIGALACLVIKPLSLDLGGRRLGCPWMLRVRDTHICRGGMLLLTLAVYYIYYLGQSLPMTDLVYLMNGRGFSTTHILVALFVFGCGMTLGYILLAFWPRNKKLYSSLLWMGLLCLIMGLVTLQMPAFLSPYLSYVATITAILGVCQVMFESILRYVIPIAFGRQYIRWIEGLLGLMAGGATIANNYIARELREVDPDGLCSSSLPGMFKTNLKSGEVSNKFFCNDYYFAGSAFLGAGVLAIVFVNVLICCRYRDRNYEKDSISSDKVPMNELPRRSGRSRRRERSESPVRNHYNYQYR